MLDELAKMLSTPVTDDELTRAREGWSKDFARELADDDQLVGMLAWDLYDGRTFAWRQALEAKVKALTPADLDAVAKKYLRLDKLVVVEAGDQKKAAAKPQP
jgi:zinc protease